MWILARSLFHQLSRVLTELDNEQLCEELVKNLKDKNTQQPLHFIKNPLTNAPKNPSQRSLISPPGKHAILSNGQKVLVDEILSRESVILSDLFDINEIDALELILTGELQTRNFNTLPRGLCAVVCYYGAHRHFITIIKMLLRLKTTAYEMMPSVLGDFIDEEILKNINFFKRILDILQHFNAKSEFEKLERPNVNGLGTEEHRGTLNECIEDIQKSCYEILCIFCHASPVELHADILHSLFDAMKVVKLQQDAPQLSVANLAIWTSILIFVNPSKLKHCSNLQQILEIFNKNIFENWANAAACSSIAFCFSIAVKCSRNYPGGFRNQFTLEESKLLDNAVDNCALQFIRTCVVNVPNYASFEVTVDIVDSFIKSFICYFPEKNQELFNVCEDELLRITDATITEEYTKKPNAYYLRFLELVTDAYAPVSPKMAALCEQFTLSKFTALVNFLTTTRTIASPRLFVYYLDMLRTFCKTERVAAFIFHVFNTNDQTLASWNRLFTSMTGYLNDLNGRSRQYSFGPKPPPKRIESYEITGLLAFLRLAKTVAEHSDDARHAFYDSHRWNAIDVSTSMLIEAFPAVIKGELYEFLASLAMDERASMRIWSSLIQKKICTYDNKALYGIQEEFNAEKTIGVYNCTVGFLKLVNQLLARKNIPSSKELTPFLQFITNSVMGTFTDGKFTNENQLYIILTLCIDSLYQLLRHFYITTESIVNNTTQVYVLGEILNDTQLSRVIFMIITECSDRIANYSPKNELREKLALSCLRLLTIAVSHRHSFVSAIRRARISKLVATMEKIFLSPLSHRPKSTYLNILMNFVSNSEHLIKHTFFVVKILRELSSQRSSLQPQLVAALLPHKELYKSVFTRLTSVVDDEISISPNDVPLYDLPDISENIKTPRLRGEIARIIIEIFVNSLEADPSRANLAYLFCGFDIDNIGTTQISSMDTVGEATNCLQSFINISEIFILHGDPFNASFSALFEPTLRLFLRMLSFKTESSTVMLRFLRGYYDLIYRLTTSSTFQKIDVLEAAKEAFDGTAHLSTFVDIARPACTDSIYRRAVQGIILQLSAVEVTSLLGGGQVAEPQRFYASLFSPAIQHLILPDGDESNETLATIPAQLKELPLIWALLENSKADCEQLSSPVLRKFDDGRIDAILDICLRENSVGVEQYDILYLQFLLFTEVDSIVSAEVKEIQEECYIIIRYCTRYNARRLLEAACVHLLSGWVAIMNTFAFFAPVSFIEIDTQKSYLIDAFFLILKYTRDIQVNEAVAGAISNTVYRLVSSISNLVAVDGNVNNRKTQLGFILKTLFDCLVVPEYAKCVSFKLDLYASIMKIFTLCSSNIEDEGKKEDGQLTIDSLASILNQRKTKESQWGSIFSQMSEGVIREISEDINFAPFQLKVVAAACLTQILREDVKENQHVALQFVKSGNVNSILSNVRSLKIDFNHILDKKNHESASYFITILALFTRLAASNVGWNALVDYLVLPTISTLKFWQDIPRGFFTGKEWKASLETPEGAYAKVFECFIQFCLAIGSNPYWRTMTCPLLEAIERNQELTNQLIRTKPNDSLTKNIALLVFYIHSLDDNAKEAIETTKCLNDLLLLHTQGAPKTGFELTNLPTRSAFNLPLNLFAARS